MAMDETGPIRETEGDALAFRVDAAGPPRERPNRRGQLPSALSAAVLSAVLASVGTWMLISASVRPTGPATPVAPAGTAASVPAAQTVAAASTSGGIVAIAARAKDWVVTITTEGAAGFSPFSLPSSGVGSGIVVSADGLILTNDHVIEGAGTLTVELPDGRHVAGRIVTTDPAHDLAVVRADATGLTPARLGDSSSLEVGSVAIAIGSPLGTFTDTVTEGIISGLERTIDVTSEVTRTRLQLRGLIQTDAAINPGNSGGPLLDAAGSVVGVITAQAGNAEGVGFAIPIDDAKELVGSASGT
jgi:serine protease Do